LTYVKLEKAKNAGSGSRQQKVYRKEIRTKNGSYYTLLSFVSLRKRKLYILPYFI
jgi:hypothetical protein